MALNVVEEVWQMVSQDDVVVEPSQEDFDSGEDLMALSDQAVQGTWQDHQADCSFWQP